jgi:hypothetical protein
VQRRLGSGEGHEIDHQAAERNTAGKVDQSGFNSSDVEDGIELPLLVWLAVVSLAGLGLLATLA